MLDEFKDAAGEAVQPYFAAFMIERSYQRAAEPFERDGHNGEYMEWNQAHWREFEIETRRPHDHHLRKTYAADFQAWLETRATDHLAQQYIEHRRAP